MDFAGTCLNIVWAALGLAAFTWFLASAGRRHTYSRKALTCRALALGLALVSLFPCVSISDDAARIALLNTQPDAEAPGHLSWAGHASNTEFLATLVGLLEVLDAAQVSAVIVLSISLCLFAMA